LLAVIADPTPAAVYHDADIGRRIGDRARDCMGKVRMSTALSRVGAKIMNAMTKLARKVLSSSFIG